MYILFIFSQISRRVAGAYVYFEGSTFIIYFIFISKVNSTAPAVSEDIRYIN
jgi:hypothetical protein